MRFSDISGNTIVKQKLAATVDNGRVSHAWLFEGTEGNGSLALAVAYAQYLSCSNKQNGDSCGECPSCVKYQKFIHPDLHFVFPVISAPKRTKPVSDDYLKEWREFMLSSNYHGFNDWLACMGTENKQAGIFAQESQNIIKKLSYKTFEAEYKVMIIWLPEKMNQSASNKLLKMIEEPPPKTVFILVTLQAEIILRTIQSRTQLIKIPKIDAQSMFDSLKEKYNFADDKIKEIIRLADGSCLRAKKIIESEGDTVSEYYTLFTDMMRLCYGAKISELITWTETVSKLGRERQKVFIDYALRLIRENFMLNIASAQKDKIVYLTDKERSFSEKFNTFIHQNNIDGLTSEFNLAHKHIERNGYDKLVFLDLALQVAKLLRKKSP